MRTPITVYEYVGPDSLLHDFYNLAGWREDPQGNRLENIGGQLYLVSVINKVEDQNKEVAN